MNAFQLFINHISDCCVIFDLNGIILQANSKFIKKMGYNTNELIGQDIDIIFLEEQRNEINELLSKLSVNDKAILKHSFYSSDAILIPYETTCFKTVIDNKEVMVLISREIATVANQVPIEQFRKCELRLNQTQKIGKIGSWEYDLVNDALFWTNEIYNIFEISAETFEPTYLSFLSAIHPEDKNNVDILFQNSIKNKLPFSYEYRLQMPDGKNKFVHHQFETIYNDSGIPLRSLGTIQDITDRKKIEIQLLENEKLMRSYICRQLDPVMIIDFQGIVQFVNNSLLEFIEVADANELIGKSFTDFLDPYTRSIAIDDLKIIQKNGGPAISEYYIKTMSGAEYWIEAHGLKIPYKGGEANLVTLRNITNQKKIQNDLRDSEINYKGLFNSIKQAIYIQDQNFRFIDVNQGAINMYGYKLEEFIGQTPEFLSANDRNDFNKIYEYLNLAFNGIPQYFEFWGRRKDGTEFPKDVWATKGKYFGEDVLIVLSSDISARKKAEEAWKQEKIFSDNLIESLPALFIMFDTDMKPLRWNKNLEFFLGLYNDDMKNFNIVNIVDDEDKERLQIALKKILSTGENNITVNIIRNDGRKYAYHLIGKMIDTSIGKAIMWIGIDINERIVIENELIKAKEKAEENDRLKTSFLQNISHEIRTPLNGILGFARILSEEDVSAEEKNEFSKIIVASGKKLNEIVDNLMDIAKIEVGQLQMKETCFSINGMLTELFYLYEPAFTEKQIEFYCYNLPSDEDIKIITDENKLYQIFSHLISNSLKFTKQGTVEYGYLIKKDIIEFFVRDTGIGVPDNYREKIFDRFVQADSSISRGYEGAGLGLAICKGLLEYMGGTIWLESNINVGSVFHFTLPLKQQTEYGEATSNNLLPKGNTAISKILVAEDNYASFILIKKILNRLNYNVIHAADGEEVCELCEQDPSIDLVFMDLKMPILNGIEATKRIKKFRPDLPVIAQTAYSYDEDKQKVIEAGCIDLITKPIDKDKLVKLVQNILI